MYKGCATWLFKGKNMISLKEYAKKKNISYEAVRKQVNRYRDELGEHLSKQGRTQFLDEEAEQFLDDKRAANPVIIVEHDKDEQIEQLKAENKNLLLKVAALQEQLLQEKDNVKMLQQEKIELLETRGNDVKEEKKPWWKIF